MHGALAVQPSLHFLAIQVFKDCPEVTRFSCPVALLIKIHALFSPIQINIFVL